MEFDPTMGRPRWTQLPPETTKQVVTPEEAQLAWAMPSEVKPVLGVTPGVKPEAKRQKASGEAAEVASAPVESEIVRKIKQRSKEIEEKVACKAAEQASAAQPEAKTPPHLPTACSKLIFA